MSGDVAGGGGGEEDNGRGDVGGLPDPLHRDGSRKRVVEALADLGDLVEQGGVGRAGADGVDCDPAGCDLARECLGERDDPALGGGVDHLAGRSDPPGVRRDVDDASGPAFQHAVEDCPATADGAEQVDVHQASPGCLVAVDKRADHIDPGVVHENVDLSELRPHPLDRGEHACRVGDVEGDAEGASGRLVGGQRVRDRNGCGAVEIGHGHRGTRLCERGGNGGPDPAGGASHDGDLALKCLGHLPCSSLAGPCWRHII